MAILKITPKDVLHHNYRGALRLVIQDDVDATLPFGKRLELLAGLANMEHEAEIADDPRLYQSVVDEVEEFAKFVEGERAAGVDEFYGEIF